MHSDGNTLAIYPDLIEIGLDAFNSQIFCIGIEKLAPFAGQICFWGEIDRQHLLPHAAPHEVAAAVREVISIFGAMAAASRNANSAPPPARKTCGRFFNRGTM
jgi:hypothetical protein